jgi:hypothetical protein
MSCEHLVCAACAGPVAEGRCPTCRTAREHRHGHGPHISAETAIVLTLLLILATFLAARLAG